MAATSTRPMGPRALPNTRGQPIGHYPYEPAWYEAEERIKPSYIVDTTVSKPPLSPSARWNAPSSAAANVPFPTQQYGGSVTPASEQCVPAPSSQQTKLPPGAAMPYHYNASSSASYQSMLPPGEQRGFAPQPSLYPDLSPGQINALSPGGGILRPHADRYQSHLVTDDNTYAPGQSARTSRNGKGSAFMHKGFFDILQLANDRDNAGTSRFLPVRPHADDPPGSPSKLRATLGRAAGALRKNSNPPAPSPLSLDDRYSIQQQLQQSGTKRFSMGATGNDPRQPHTTDLAFSKTSATPAMPGPRAAKKRISIDMVSAPRPSSFVHAAHASDAEQAEAILNRWGRDGVGKVADPLWVEPIKEALRQQAARNQAEAIAQVQAALHQDSAFTDQQRTFHITNGAPSTVTSSTMTGATVTTGEATIGHSSTSHASGLPNTSPLATPAVQSTWVNPFHDIVEEARTGSGSGSQSEEYAQDVPTNFSQQVTPQKARPVMARQDRLSPQLKRDGGRPGMPRSNTAGTTLFSSSPSPSDKRHKDTPDYMAYREVAAPSVITHTDQQQTGKAIDGLPGAGPGITKMFESPQLSPQRPTSMVVKESARTNDVVASSVVHLSMPAGFPDAGPALRPSLTTVEKSVAAKIYFENLYYGILKRPAARETRRAGMEKELAALRVPEASKEAIRQAWIARETEHLRQVRDRVGANAFTKLKTIGHGAFGVVALVREKRSGELFAMKQLRKADMLRKGQEGHVRAERDLMTSASASGSRRWIVNLVYSFQDVDHLYLIMEFMGGGDLLNLLIEKDIFAEDFARFYVAEMILAVHEAHRLGYIHRDIKPDNFLFTSDGHIKLADFGLCQSFHWAHDGAYYDQQRRNLLKKHGIDLEDAGGRRSTAVGSRSSRPRGGQDGAGLDDRQLGEVMSDRNADGTPLTHVLTWRDKNKKKIAYSVVGTNNYMAPEVLRGLGYDQSCDWWSLGVIVFEMLYGYPPFVSKSRHLTRQKILNWRQTLRFPPKPKVSREAQDFIARLVCEKDDRLGSTNAASVSRPNSLMQGARQQSGFAATNGVGAGGLADGVDELMSHPWFKGIDWGELHRQRAPFKPDLAHPADTKHFEDDIEDAPLAAPGASPAENGGVAPPPDPARDPMLRDKDHGPRLLEMRKQLAFVGYTFKRPPAFDPREIQEVDVLAAEQAAEETARRMGMQPGGASAFRAMNSANTTGSRMRSMSM